MSIILPIYDSHATRDAEVVSPSEGELVIVKDDEFLVMDVPTPTIQLCAFVDGSWIDFGIYASTEAITNATEQANARLMKEQAEARAKNPPPSAPPLPTREEHLAQFESVAE
jgi:hypothetical protein